MATGASSSPPKRGRPKHNFEYKKINLRKNVFDEWNAKKGSLGFNTRTHSDFAEHLLKYCEETKEQRTGKDSPTHPTPFSSPFAAEG